MAQRAVNEEGIHLSWPMVGVILTVVVWTIIGSVRLGAVQTHVSINTTRVDLLESHEHERIADLARIKARQEMNERRLDVIESTRPTAETLNSVAKSAETAAERIEQRVRALENAPRAPLLK